MNKLLSQVVETLGGLERWMSHAELSATVVTGGGLWPMKGIVQDAGPRRMRVSLHEQRASVAPFGKPKWRTAFTAGRVAIETVHGDVVQERSNPRAAFSGHVMNTLWDPLHRAYSTGMRCGPT